MNYANRLRLAICQGWPKGLSEAAYVASIAYSTYTKKQLEAPAPPWQQFSIQGWRIDLYRDKMLPNFIKRIKAPIFFKVVLATEKIKETLIEIRSRRQLQHLRR